MTKRPSSRSIKAVRTYTVPEAATALGVTIGTVRNWVRNGLPVLNAKRPTLILGSVLRDYIDRKWAKYKVTLALDQLYCLTCKEPRTPYGRMLDYIPGNHRTGRLTGLCEVCGGVCNRMASRASLDRFAEIFDVAIRGAGVA
jgi:Helix-turn-helix domain